MNPQAPQTMYLLSNQIQSVSWYLVMQLAAGAASVPIIYGFMSYIRSVVTREVRRAVHILKNPSV